MGSHRLSAIQKQLKVGKDNYNSFGKYAYRSASDILEAVKPLLMDDETITLDDEIVMVGDRHYIKATVTFHASDGDHTSHGWAREQKTKTGSDEAQITGGASSYARKYALCGLFAIDDSSDDPDRTNDHDKQQKPAPKQKAPARQQRAATTQRKAQAQQEADKGADGLSKARGVLNQAIERWAAANGADAKKAKAGITKRPDYEQTEAFYLKAAKEFEESTPGAEDAGQK